MVPARRRVFLLRLLILLGMVGWLVCVITLYLVGQHLTDSATAWCAHDVVRCLHQATLGLAFLHLSFACMAAPPWIVVFVVWSPFRRGQAGPVSESMQETNSGSQQRPSAGSRRPRIVVLGTLTAILALLLTLAEMGATLAGKDGLSHSIGFFIFLLNALVSGGFIVLSVASSASSTASSRTTSRTTDGDA